MQFVTIFVMPPRTTEKALNLIPSLSLIASMVYFHQQKSGNPEQKRIMKNFAASMLRLQELKSIFIYLFQETLIAMAVRFTDPLLTILMMAKTYMIHAVKQKKGGGSPQCHLIKTLADRPPRFFSSKQNYQTTILHGRYGCRHSGGTSSVTASF